MNILFIDLLNIVLFIEAIILYFIAIRRIELLSSKWDSSIKEKYLFSIFRSILDFISSDEIIEESLMGVTLANSSAFNLSDFKSFLESKIKNEKDKILKISKGIEELERIEREIARISYYIQNSKYINLSILPLLLLPLLLPHNISNVLLGISLGLEIISLYFILYSYFIHKGIINKISSCCK